MNEQFLERSGIRQIGVIRRMPMIAESGTQSHPPPNRRDRAVQQGARKAVIRLNPGLCKAPGADFEGSIPAAEMSGFVPLQECRVGAISLN